MGFWFHSAVCPHHLSRNVLLLPCVLRIFVEDWDAVGVWVLFHCLWSVPLSTVLMMLSLLGLLLLWWNTNKVFWGTRPSGPFRVQLRCHSWRGKNSKGKETNLLTRDFSSARLFVLSLFFCLYSNSSVLSNLLALILSLSSNSDSVTTTFFFLFFFFLLLLISASFSLLSLFSSAIQTHRTLQAFT